MGSPRPGGGGCTAGAAVACVASARPGRPLRRGSGRNAAAGAAGAAGGGCVAAALGDLVGGVASGGFQMRAIAIQCAPGADKAANIGVIAAMVEAAAAGERPALVSLPEMWSCLGAGRAEKLAQSEVLPPPGQTESAGPAFRFLSETARRLGVTLHGGSIGERDGETLFNTTLVFGPDGAELGRYRIDPSVRRGDAERPGVSGKQPVWRGGPGGDVRGGRGEAGAVHLLRCAVSGAVRGAAASGGGGDFRAVRVHGGDGAGALGGSAAGAGD